MLDCSFDILEKLCKTSDNPRKKAHFLKLFVCMTSSCVVFQPNHNRNSTQTNDLNFKILYNWRNWTWRGNENCISFNKNINVGYTIKKS